MAGPDELGEDRSHDAAPAAPPARKGILWPLRRLYDWVLSWSSSPYGSLALFALAFAEASFFPVPPDVLLMALAMGKTRRSFLFAAACTAGSVLGGVAGYGIGFAAAPLARHLITALAGPGAFFEVARAYGDNAFVAICIAGFTPIPYKVFTLAAGIFHENVGLDTLILASVLSRGARFFLVAGLIFLLGQRIKRFIDRYFDLLAVIFTVGLIGGFVALGAGSSSEAPIDRKIPVLLDQLRHPDMQLKAEALAELQEIAASNGPAAPSGFDPELDAAANAKALEAWREWAAEALQKAANRSRDGPR